MPPIDAFLSNINDVGIHDHTLVRSAYPRFLRVDQQCHAVIYILANVTFPLDASGLHSQY